jgi:neutral amino acid transport system ATP-binding protein
LSNNLESDATAGATAATATAPANAAPAKKVAPVKSVNLHKGEIVPGVSKVDPIIVADNVTRTFGGLKAVDVDHLEIPRNAITALIGPNGAGKTTLFNLLTGFDKPDSGTWTFAGQALAGIPAYKVAGMGQIRTFQLTKSLNLLSVLDNMKLGAKGQAGESFLKSLFPFFWKAEEKAIEEKAMEILARFKLEMARALMSDPTLVMLDEPMAGVNPALTQTLLDHILDLKTSGMTVLFVEHDMQMVRHIADWVVVMAEGKVVAEGPPDTVMQNPAVIDAYLGSHHDSDLGDPTEHVSAIKELLNDDDQS